MARDEIHGGGSWAFPNCVWAPTEKRGGGAWPFWRKVLDIQEGDIVLHLRGVPPNANFVGYSFASGSGFETTRRPPVPKSWDFAKRFYRCDLSDFTLFHQPINLTDLFESRRTELDAFFDANISRGASKLNIFFVKQAGRLQCLNGAYLSDVDEELLNVLFGSGGAVIVPASGQAVVSVETSVQISRVRTRLGQAKFSAAIKELYGNRCCFPGCSMTDVRFLVGSHIARWSDNETLRGHLGNGLCFCLLHDKAFEIGLFTLDEKFKVFVNPKEQKATSDVVRELLAHNGEQISLSKIRPLDDALLEHWIRVDIEPWATT